MDPRALYRSFSSATFRRKAQLERAKVAGLGRLIEHDYAEPRPDIDIPRHPIVLAHGLFGFDELDLTRSLSWSRSLPVPTTVQYWRGIKEAFAARGVPVISVPVPSVDSIEDRAGELARGIEAAVGGTGADEGGDGSRRQDVNVNIIAHSMGGLDARFLISKLKPTGFNVRSLTTIATPHRGSYIADYLLDMVGDKHVAQVFALLEKIGWNGEGFRQLTRQYMTEHFNPAVPDLDGVKYFSYGAAFVPRLWSVFRQTQRWLEAEEGPNDGVVSVRSSRWGGPQGYRGTLFGINHLDLINWTNRVKRWVLSLREEEPKFNAITFYLDIADMLAKEGL